MRETTRWSLLLALVLAFGLAVAACGGDDDEDGDDGGAADTAAAGDEGTNEPIVIGAAVDLTGQMAPFDGPAVTAAQIQVDKINAEGGVDGRELELEVIDHQLDPERTKSAAIELIDGGADVLLVTCDVDYATPAVQEAITRGVLAVAPCIGTDQMGPERFGEQGKLAFSLGNVAQDEGAAMAEYAMEQGWERAATATDNVIVYFQDVVKAFADRYAELGGEIVVEESWTQGDGTIQNVVSALDNANVDVIATSTAFDDMPAMVGGLRSLGNDTPIICGWSCDGAYWLPEGTSNFYVVTYASVFGDDPSDEVKELIGEMEAQDQAPGTGGFVTGAASIDAIAAAIEETGGTEGEQLAEAFEGFDGLETISGAISFSEEFHSVFGREYRVMEVQDSQPSFVELRAASSPAEIE
ncbi:MAG TPA: ABC transporter substrate-binding protein [Gaiellaceae bacterium]|nr:ABC transporter substrate-binding protein [Gaiellaceae bacterium]